MRSPAVPHRPPPAPPPDPDLLDEWVAAGLIDAEQADHIRAYEQGQVGPRPGLTTARSPGATGPSLVVEALGYLGGVIMLVGAGILVGLYWTDVPVALRLVLVGAAALALLAGGVAVPDRLGEAAGRLRAVLWALAVAAAGGFFGILTADVLDRHDESSLIVVGTCTALVGGILWWLRRTWLQQLAFLLPLVMAAQGLAFTITGDLDNPWGGTFTWVVGVAWVALAWSGRLDPRTTGMAFGALAAIFGALGVDSQVGIAIGLATAVAVVALALAERSLPLLAVAAFGMLRTAPRAATEWFPGPLSAAVTLMVTGALLIVAAIHVARHRAGSEPQPLRPPRRP